MTKGDPSVDVKILVADNRFELIIGSKTIKAATRVELFDGITARNVSGVLACLDSWRRMLRDGTDKFGDCYYRGTVPLLGARPLRDCVVAVSGELETSWLSHPETKLVESIDVVADRDDDPVELLITWGQDKTQMPLEMDVRYGTDSVLTLKLTGWKLGKNLEATQ